MAKAKEKMPVRDLCLIALFTAIIAVCAQITIPMTVPFTLQTFAVMLTCGVLGGRRGTISVALYIIMGAIGLPVFASFNGGISYLLGSTGGYIVGFFFGALLMWAMERLTKRSMVWMGISMVLSVLVCYAFGTAWFAAVYVMNGTPQSLGTILSWCVIPFILPDLAKCALALDLTDRLARVLPRLEGRKSVSAKADKGTTEK